jgi:hypothetical protein
MVVLLAKHSKVLGGWPDICNSMKEDYQRWPARTSRIKLFKHLWRMYCHPSQSQVGQIMILPASTHLFRLASGLDKNAATYIGMGAHKPTLQIYGSHTIKTKGC